MHLAICNNMSLGYGGGGETFVLMLAREMKAAGHEVSIYCLPYNPSSHPHRPVIPEGVSYHETPIATIDADVAYVMYAPFMWIPYRFKCPAIAGFHSGVFFLNRVNIRYGLLPLSVRSLFKLFGRLDLRRYEAVRLPHKNSNFPHRNTIVLPEFADSQVFRPSARKRDKFTVAYVGRPVWQRGWDLFRKVVKKTHEKSDIEFVSLGQTKSIPNVQSLGYVSDRRSLAEIYSQVHLVILPARADTFCHSSVESLLCGTPVLTTPLKAHFDMTLPFLYGANEIDFVDAISKVRSMWNDNKEEYWSLQSKCVEAARNYDLKTVVPQWLAMFRDISQHPSQRRTLGVLQ